MMRLALASLRNRLTAFLGTFLASLLAVALIGGAALLLFSVLTATPTTHRFDAADIMVSGDRSITLQSIKDKGKGKVKTKTKSEALTGAPILPADWAAKISAIPGVASITADSSFPVVLSNGHRAVAHGWESASLMPFTLGEGHAPKAGEIVVDAKSGLHVGDKVSLTSRDGTQSVRVAGVVAQTLEEQSAVFLAAGNGTTAYGVTLQSGADAAAVASQIEQALGIDTVYTGSDKVHADLPGALPNYIGAISIFGFVIGITAFATVFVLTGTVALAVRQRLREMALLRATGATPRQLGRMLRAETLFVTLAAMVAGIPLGILTAQVIASRFRELGAVPAQFEVSINVAVLLAAGAVVTLVAQLSARLAARRAINIAPAQALHETVVEGSGGWAVRTFAALVCTIGAVIILGAVPLDGPFGMGMTFISSALLLCAVGAAGPLIVKVLGSVLSRVTALTGITGWLAGAFTRAENKRITSVAVPLALMFAINAPMLLNGNLSEDLAISQQNQRTAGAASVASGAYPLDFVRQLKDVAATIPTRLILDEGGKPEDYQAQGLFTSGNAPLDLAFTQGSFQQSGLAISQSLAKARDWTVGQNVPIWLPDGVKTEMPITGIYFRNRGFGDLVAPAELIAQHDPRGLVTFVASRQELPFGQPVSVLKSGDADKQQGAWEIMIAVSLGFTAIAVANTFAVAAAARRNQFEQLRLIGATHRQIRRTTTREAVLAVVIGLVMGVVVTSIVVGAFSVAQDGEFRLIGDPAAYGTLLGFVGLLGLVAGIVPARMVLRRVR